ncbi:MAG TPA: flagellar motor protein MotD [Methylotenera sp.]|nr:flagellar motor protein MotD [Methylotenera sp.]HPH04949.1 flagellar motor protein MotD [Methylotenera sp.]HPN02207.1 flagellar motor protein MotD [Methylotenera sp.]
MIRRKHLEDDDDNHERWLVSYADFITLLFAFFVVMYAISSVNQSKYEQLTSAMGSAFMGNLSPDGKIIQINKDSATQATQPKSMLKPLPLSHIYAERSHKEREAMLKVGVDLSSKLSTLVSENKVNIGQNSRGVQIDINDSLLFEAGSAELSEKARPIMLEVATILKATPYAIQVEGHTDNTPIHSEILISNWELSALRASSVVRMLSSLEIAENRLSATGFGSTQPISENETPEGRGKNRRVAILILYGSKNQIDDVMPITAASKIE